MKTCLTLAAAVALVLTTLSVADAETSVPLATTVAEAPLVAVTDAVIDHPHGQVFVSSQSEGRIAVVDLATGEVSRLPYLADAGAMDLDDSGAYLWVAQRSEGAVARVSTTPPYETTVFPLGFACPHDVVATAGVVYVTTDGDCYSWWDEVVRLDPDTGEARRSAVPTVWSPVLREVPGTGRVHWQSLGISDLESGIVDAATDTVLATAQDSVAIAAMPDGDSMLTADGDLLSTTDLSVTGHVALPPRQWSGDDDPAITPDGVLAYADGEQVVVHDLSAGAAIGRWQLDPVASLAVEDQFWDGSTLYAVGGRDPVRVVRVADVRAPLTSTLTVDDPARPVVRGSDVTLSGRLSDGSGAPIAGAPIRLRALNGADVLASAVTAPDGTWSAVVTVDTYRLRVGFPGDDLHEPAVATVPFWFATYPVLHVDGPGVAAPADTLVYQGSVVDQEGGPVPGEEVSVYWWCPYDAGFDEHVLTDADGLFRYATKAPRCSHVDVFFRVTGSSDEVQVGTDIGWRISALSADGPDRLAPGETGTWTATLTVDGAPVAGAAVQFRASQDYGSETGTLTTDADGVVTLTTDGVPSISNGVRFRYAGDGTTLGSEDTVLTQVAPWPSTLTVAPDDQTPTAGEPLTLTGLVALGDGESPEGRMVQVTRDYGRQLPTVVVAADGSFALTTRPASGHHEWTFRFAGDGQHAAAEGTVALEVAEATTTLTTETVTAAPSSTRRAFRTTADPGYADMCLRFRVQQRSADGWRTVSSSRCRPTDEAGVARYRTSGDLHAQQRYRVRTTFAGDRWTAAAAGPWRSFRLG